jgi:hypothetical protein
MGTRADFYVRKDEQMEWVGSITWDGYEIGNVGGAKDEASFRRRLNKFFSYRDDVTLPDNGWPWPWNNSKLTDEIWVWNCEDNSIYRGHDHEGKYEDNTTAQYFSKGMGQFGYTEKGEEIENPDRSQLKGWILPDMKDIKNVKLGGKGSGLIVIQG